MAVPDCMRVVVHEKANIFIVPSHFIVCARAYQRHKVPKLLKTFLKMFSKTLTDILCPLTLSPL